MFSNEGNKTGALRFLGTPFSKAVLCIWKQIHSGSLANVSCLTRSLGSSLVHVIRPELVAVHDEFSDPVLFIDVPELTASTDTNI